MSLQNRWEPRSSSQLQGQKILRPCPTNTHTSLATDIPLLSSSHCFFVFFFLPLDTNRLRGKSSFRLEPLRTPPYEPSRLDIQFYYDFKEVYTEALLELPKDDQVLLLQGFNNVL